MSGPCSAGEEGLQGAPQRHGAGDAPQPPGDGSEDVRGDVRPQRHAPQRPHLPAPTHPQHARGGLGLGP